MSRLVLASGSRWRHQLLDRLGIPYTWSNPNIDESAQPGEAPSALVHRLALAKAACVAADYPAHLVIGSDQVAVCEGEILGKPGSIRRSEEHTSELQSRGQ